MPQSLTEKLSRANGLTPETAKTVKAFLFDLVGAFSAAEDALNRLDAIASRGNFGTRLNAVFQGLSDRMRYSDDETFYAAMEKFAAAFSSLGGGAGAVLADWVAQIVAGLADVDPGEPLRPQVAELLYLTMEATRFRWRLKVADKGFFTVLCPAVKVLFANAQLPPDELARKLADAAEKALFQSRSLRARVGRANFLGRRSVGYTDAGSYAAYVCVATYCRRHIPYDQPRLRTE